MANPQGLAGAGRWFCDPLTRGRFVVVCASAIETAKSRSRRVIAIGTSVVRALESAASADGTVRAGEGQASGRIARGALLCVVDAILTGVHQPGESHYELVRAFADDRVLDRLRAAADERGYRTHEFGDSLLIERQGAEVEVALATTASISPGGLAKICS